MFITSGGSDRVYVVKAVMTREDIYGYLIEFIIIVAGVLIAEVIFKVVFG